VYAMSNDLILMLCGLHSVALATFHLLFWRIFKWPETLATTNFANRVIPQIENVQLIWLFLWIAVLCFAFPQSLGETALGHAILFGMSGFWCVRTIQQFVFLRVRHAGVHALTVVFAIGAVLFALPLLRK
jgi:hypothetical protein